VKLHLEDDRQTSDFLSLEELVVFIAVTKQVVNGSDVCHARGRVLDPARHLGCLLTDLDLLLERLLELSLLLLSSVTILLFPSPHWSASMPRSSVTILLFSFLLLVDGGGLG
jgi:hypothetical protein